MSEQALATVDEKSNAVAVYDYGDDAGGGFENTTKDDFKIPFLRVLQSNSPAVVDGLVEGAKPGLIINTVTQALFPSILFIPAITQHLMVGWKKRGEGAKGGAAFTGVWGMDDPMVQEAIKQQGGKFNRGEDKKIIKPQTPGGEDLVETVYIHGVQLVEETGAVLPGLVSFSSTGLPVSQAWLTTAQNERTGKGEIKPLYAHVYRLNVAKQVNSWGTFFNFAPTWAKGSAAASLLPTNGSLFQAARTVREQVLGGKAEIDHAAQGNAGSEAGRGGSKAEKDAEIPF